MSYGTDEAWIAGMALPKQPVREAVSVKDIIRRHHAALIQFLTRRLRVSADAADVAQETYIRMLQYEGSREIQSPASLLYRIAINVANDHGRAEQARRVTEQCRIDDVELESDLPSADREIAAQEELELLHAAIAALPARCQQVFLLSRVQRMTYPQIARHCGISVKMVEKHISHALELCLKKVQV
jgi:RNA polymerase sigma-70 factor (ECF subfamily)